MFELMLFDLLKKKPKFGDVKVERKFAFTRTKVMLKNGQNRTVRFETYLRISSYNARRGPNPEGWYVICNFPKEYEDLMDHVDKFKQ